MYIAHFEITNEEPERMHFSFLDEGVSRMSFSATKKEPLKFIISENLSLEVEK